MTAPDDAIVTSGSGAARTVLINRPHRRNALRVGDVRQLTAAIAEAARDPECRVVVLGGADGWLCAGGDLGEDTAIDSPSSDAIVGEFETLLTTILDSSLPVVTVLEGMAVGAGAAMALAADVCIASPTAELSLPWLARGMVPDAGVAFLVTRRLGPMVAKRLLFAGEPVGATQAHDLGLVTELAADPWASADAWRERLAAGPRYATTLTKRLVNAAAFDGLDSFLRLERSSVASVFGSAEPAEGFASFRERREANFR